MPLSGQVEEAGAAVVAGLVGLTDAAEEELLLDDGAAVDLCEDDPQPATRAEAKAATPVRASVLRPRRERFGLDCPCHTGIGGYSP